jgi:hypothetical protein
MRTWIFLFEGKLDIGQFMHTFRREREKHCVRHLTVNLFNKIYG